MTSMLNFIPNVMRQASLSLRPPIIAPPTLQRESSFTGAETGRVMGWARIARQSPDVGTVHSKTYFDWRQPRATRQRFTNSTVSWMDSAGNLLGPHHTTRAVAPATVHTRINMQFLRSMRT